MEDQLETGAWSPLNRKAYAVRFGACMGGLIVYGLILGLVFRSSLASDPVNAWQQMYGLLVAGSMIGSGFFVYFTYRRALDCWFGRNGKAWIAVLVALPTLALPNLSFLVFAVMMFIKSAPQHDETSEIEDDSGVLRPLQAGE